MKIYIDDERMIPDATRDEGFKDYLKKYSLLSAVCWYMHKTITEMPYITHISFDHDLGDDDIATGYDLLRWTIETYLLARLQLPTITIHSANPAGAERMERLLEEYNQRR